MKKRFTDEQIIGFLKQADGGVRSRNCADSMAFLMPRSIHGVPSLAG